MDIEDERTNDYYKKSCIYGAVIGVGLLGLATCSSLYYVSVQYAQPIEKVTKLIRAFHESGFTEIFLPAATVFVVARTAFYYIARRRESNQNNQE